MFTYKKYKRLRKRVKELETIVAKCQCERRKEISKKPLVVEQFCDDLQRMKRLEEDSEEFQRGLSIVK